MGDNNLVNSMKRAVLIFSILFLSHKGFAQTPFFTESDARMSLVYTTFGGEQGDGLTSGSVGYAGEVLLRKGNSWMGVISSFKGMSIRGTEVLDDGGTDITATHTMLIGEAGLGLTFNLMPTREFAFRPYFGANGVASFISAKLQDQTYSVIDKSAAVVGTGSELILGCELKPGRKAQNQKSLAWIFEVRLRNVNAKLFNRDNFGISGVSLVGGIGF